MIRRRDLAPRLAGPLSRRPLRVAAGAVLIGLLGVTGLFRFAVDSARVNVVGRGSAEGERYARFATTFGADPITVVFTAANASAPYLEQNIRRLGALEIDLAHDARVASVLGPGTLGASLNQAAVAEVNQVFAEYPYFVAETDYLNQVSKGITDQNALSQRVQSDISNAQALLDLYIAKATRDAILARANFKSQSGDRIIDAQEKAVDAAIAPESVPPLWAEYLAPPGQAADTAGAQRVFDRLAAAIGACDTTIAGLLGIPSDCQAFFERSLLDLPGCPTVGSKGVFCAPKAQWATVLPPPTGGSSYMVITVRLKPAAAADRAQAQAVRDKITSQLAHGIADDAYTRSLSSASLTTLRALGPLRPTECAGQSGEQNSACKTAFKDAPMVTVIGGTPLVDAAAADAMQELLVILVPASLLVMLLVLVGLLRIRGRLWPLLAAVAATLLSFGVALLAGMAVTPGVLAAIPIVLGVGVQYSCWLVARFADERSAGADSDGALRAALADSGAAGATALASVAGLLVLALLTAIDWGPFIAVPYIGELALVLAGGVALGWLAALFVALPLAVHSDRRHPQDGGARPAPTPAARTTAIADNWLGVVVPVAVLALAGWALLRLAPVQSDAGPMVNQSLPELGELQTVQEQTGVSAEVDLYLQGQVVTGAFDAQTGTPRAVEWQCQAARDILTGHSGAVVEALSVADLFIGGGTSTASTSAPPCVAGAAGTPQSPAATPSPSVSPAASPTAHRAAPAAEPVARRLPQDAAATPSPSPAASSPGATPSASPAPAPGQGGRPVTQTLFLCDLRLFPSLSRVLVMDIAREAAPCPAVDKYQRTFLSTDASPIAPTSARVLLGVAPRSADEEARLVDSLRREVASPPAGLTAAPTGLPVLAGAAVDTLRGRLYLLNVLPLLAFFVALLALRRDPRRALLAAMPAAVSAGLLPLAMLLFSRLPGTAGVALGSVNPISAAAGALSGLLGVHAAAALLSRFDAARAAGATPDDAASAALAGSRSVVLVPWLSLGAGFAVLAASGLFPGGIPAVAGFAVLMLAGAGLALLAAHLLVLPLALAMARRASVAVEVPAAARAVPAKRAPGVSGRRRTREPEAEDVGPAPQTPARHPTRPGRRPGVSGRRRPRNGGAPRR